MGALWHVLKVVVGFLVVRSSLVSVMVKSSLGWLGGRYDAVRGVVGVTSLSGQAKRRKKRMLPVGCYRLGICCGRRGPCI